MSPNYGITFLKRENLMKNILPMVVKVRKQTKSFFLKSFNTMQVKILLEQIFLQNQMIKPTNVLTQLVVTALKKK